MSLIDQYIDGKELPSIEDALKIAEEVANNGESEPDVEDEPKEAETKPAEEPAEPEPKAETEPNEDDSVILTADGKHQIPYDVLKRERAEKAELQRQIDALKAEAELPKGVEFEVMSQEKLDELKEYFPEEYELIGKQQQALIDAQKRLSEFDRKERERSLEAERKAKEEVLQLIDENQRLSYWQENKPEIFNRAIEMEQVMMNDPDIQKLSMKERFEKVAQAVAAIYGDPIKAESKPEPIKEEPKPNPKGITSLSDVTGLAAETTEFEKLENMSTADLGAKFQRMTEEQRQEFLASL